MTSVRFLLVHGMAHGSWCWEPLIDELGDLGWPAEAVDLFPGDDSPNREVPTLRSLRDLILAALRPGDVVVAHSWGGVPVTVAMTTAATAASQVVYLASIVPTDGEPALSSASRSSTSATALAASGRVVDADGWAGYESEDGARDLFFHDCDSDVARWAVAHLGKVPPIDEIVRLGSARLPPSTYLSTVKDRVLSPERQRSMAARLGAVPLELVSGHSPFLSQPRDLARLLVQLVDCPTT